jgi:hypothetical protein
VVLRVGGEDEAVHVEVCGHDVVLLFESHQFVLVAGPTATLAPRRTLRRKKNSLRSKIQDLCPCQGCNIFLDTIYQHWENIPNYNKIYQMAIKYNNCPKNLSNGLKIDQMSVARPSKIYPNWFQNIPSGNPGP